MVFFLDQIEAKFTFRFFQITFNLKLIMEFIINYTTREFTKTLKTVIQKFITISFSISTSGNTSTYFKRIKININKPSTVCVLDIVQDWMCVQEVVQCRMYVYYEFVEPGDIESIFYSPVATLLCYVLPLRCFAYYIHPKQCLSAPIRCLHYIRVCTVYVTCIYFLSLRNSKSPPRSS